MIEENKIYKIISEHFGIPIDQISHESNFYTDFNASSIEIADLSPVLEKQLHTKISEDTISSIKTVGELVSLIEDNLDEF